MCLRVYVCVCAWVLVFIYVCIRQGFKVCIHTYNVKNHFTCNIFIRVVILKELEQEQLWATWEAGELNRQPVEVNFTEAFLFSTFFHSAFSSPTFFKFARNMESSTEISISTIINQYQHQQLLEKEALVFEDVLIVFSKC